MAATTFQKRHLAASQAPEAAAPPSPWDEAVKTVRQAAKGDMDCPLCKGTGRHGARLPSSVMIRVVKCVLCDGSGVVEIKLQNDPHHSHIVDLNSNDSIRPQGTVTSSPSPFANRRGSFSGYYDCQQCGGRIKVEGSLNEEQANRAAEAVGALHDREHHWPSQMAQHQHSSGTAAGGAGGGLSGGAGGITIPPHGSGTAAQASTHPGSGGRRAGKATSLAQAVVQALAKPAQTP